jgi:hypothetical protein
MPQGGNRSISRIRETFDGHSMVIQNFDAGGAKEIRIDNYNLGWGGADWARSMGGLDDEEGYDLIQTSDSGFALVGYTASFGIGPDNIFLVKTATDGNYISTPNIYTSVNDLANNERLLIYPNPFSETIFFNLDKHIFNDEKTIHIVICDITGKEIMNEEKDASFFSSGPSALKIPAEKFSPGVYFFNLNSKKASLHQKLMYIPR